MDTKDKILDTAQRLIGDQGYAATSLRHIIAEAGVNLAAIHYHFGSKEELLDAIIGRKVGPVNEERMARLQRVVAGVPSVKKVLEAWLLPMAEAADRDGSFVRLMGRMMSEGMMQGVVAKHFRAPAERIAAVLRTTVPDLPEDEFRWRMHFMIGAMAHTMCGSGDITGLGGDTKDFRGRIDRLVTFLTAAFQAPATRARRSEGNQ